MKTFLAVIAYALSLFGIDVGSHVRTDRVSSNGIDILYSKVVAQPTGTRFECLRSASGQCYYTVFPQQCTQVPGTTAVDCTPGAVEHFALARGDTRRTPPLPTLRMCVSAEADVAKRACD